MTAIALQSSRLAWLTAGLNNKRDGILGLLRRLTGFGPASSLRPRMLNKFLRMMDEVAAAKSDETSLIGQIEAVEQKHRRLKAAKALRQAKPCIKQTQIIDINDDFELVAERPAQGALWLAALWYFFLRQKNNQKKQGLTVD